MKSVSTRKMKEREWKCNMFLEDFLFIFFFFLAASENYSISFFYLFIHYHLFIWNGFLLFLLLVLLLLFLISLFLWNLNIFSYVSCCLCPLATAVFMSPNKLLLFGIFMSEICKWKGFWRKKKKANKFFIQILLCCSLIVWNCLNGTKHSLYFNCLFITLVNPPSFLSLSFFSSILKQLS